MATNEIKFKSDVAVFGNFNTDSFSISRLETANLPALTVDGAVAYDTTKQSLTVYDLANTEWKISNGSILQEDNLSIRPQGQVQFSDGNPRGANSVDLQTVRNAVDQVASGDYDVISGGRYNKIDSVNTPTNLFVNTIGGGENNTIVASYVSTIGGGEGNVLSTGAGVIGGGSYNEIYAGWQNSIFSGQANLIGAGPGDDSGEGNYIASGYYNTIGFQLGEQLISYNSICGGGNANWIDAGTYNTLGGGRDNQITKVVSTSSELPSYNTMMGGRGNKIYDGNYNTILGGYDNAVTGSYSVAFGRRAVTVNESVVLFADETTNVFSDVAANSFNIQASGGLRLVDGNEGVGKVLTCDANGTGHWNPRGVDSITVGEGLSIDNADAQVPIITLTDGAGASVVSQETAPTSPSEGDLWFDTVEGLLYVYYDDGNDSPQWVSSSTGSVGPQGEDGAVGATGAGGAYSTSFNGPHDITESRNTGNAGNSLGPVTVDTGLSYIVGDLIIVSGDPSPGNFQTAQVTSYDSVTGVMEWNHLQASTIYSNSQNWNINLTGAPGNDGAVGATGPNGNDGAVGATGPNGTIGATGPNGNDGTIGATGPNGNDGTIGATGPNGNDGTIGATGPNGVDGAVGATGSNGVVSYASYSVVNGSKSNTGVLTLVEDLDPDAIGTVSAGVVTLGAGTYQITHYGEYYEDDTETTTHYLVNTRHNSVNQNEFIMNESQKVLDPNTDYESLCASFIITSASSQTVDIFANEFDPSTTLEWRNVKLSILKLA